MARDFGQVKLSIWNDDDFLDLTPAAQHLYIVFLSSPGLSWAGVNDWHPGRLAARARGWTKEAVIAAAGELSRSKFIVIDPDTDEVLVRSFVRNDGFMKQPNLATSMARAFATVGSRTLQGVIVHELNRLKEEEPELAGWRSEEASVLLKKRAIDPHANPFHDPSVEGGIDPSIDPQIDPSIEGEWHPSVDPSVDPSHTTATTTTTFTARREGESSSGVKGGLGGEGESDGKPSGGKTESAPSPEISADVDSALDALAATAADRPHIRGVCPRHPDGDTGQACQGCAQAKRERESDAQAEKRSRQSAIDSCHWCDDRGLVEAHDHDGRPVALKCHHRETPPVYEPPEPDPEPRFDPADFLTKLRTGNKPPHPDHDDQPLPKTGTGPF